uniref:Uncharacterized protein n=1 Tax=Graphocephala atropunctata TaxID=36148 RepID=A0A1B6MCZ4_9HEMI
MTKLSSLVVGTIMFITINGYLHQPEEIEINSSRPIQARISKFLCFVGLWIFLKKSNINFGDINCIVPRPHQPTFICDLITSLCSFFFMNMFWEMFESFLLAELPSIVTNTVLRFFGTNFQIGEEKLTPLLLSISLMFVTYSLVCTPSSYNIILDDDFGNDFDCEETEKLEETLYGLGDADPNEGVLFQTQTEDNEEHYFPESYSGISMSEEIHEISSQSSVPFH